MSPHQRERTTNPIRTELAGITSARQSLDNVLSAKSNLEQISSWQAEDLADIGCALDLQIGELEGMLAEIMDERFARMMDESQPDDESRNTGLLNFIIDTADNILASLLSANDTPPTYQKHHTNTQSGFPTRTSPSPRPKVESANISFPLPLDPSENGNRNDKRRRSFRALYKKKSKVSKADHPISSTNAAPAPTRSVPTKSSNNKLVGFSKPSPSPNPFRSFNLEGGLVKSQEEDKIRDSTTIDDLSFSAFHALQDSEAFKTLLNHSENKYTSQLDRDNLWFSFREAFGNNLSRELLCAFDILIRVSSSERSSKEVDKSGLGDVDKGKTSLKSTSSSVVPPTSRSPSPSTDFDFVTIESPDTQQNISKSNNIPETSSSLHPPPYTQHHRQTFTKSEPSSSRCIICGNLHTVVHTHNSTNSILKAPCGHTFCSACAEWTIEEYVRDESFHRIRCRCNECIPKGDIERFIAGYRNEEHRERLLVLFREKYDGYEARLSGRGSDK